MKGIVTGYIDLQIIVPYNRLNFLGWTLEEMEKATGIKKSRLSEISANGNISKIGNSINEWTDKGKSVEETIFLV
jgi:hypothetical protein